MNVPPASTKRSRIAVEVSGSMEAPKFIAPRQSALTVRRLARVRYCMWWFSNFGMDLRRHGGRLRPTVRGDLAIDHLQVALKIEDVTQHPITVCFQQLGPLTVGGRAAL